MSVSSGQASPRESVLANLLCVVRVVLKDCSIAIPRRNRLPLESASKGCFNSDGVYPKAWREGWS
jgi:hypothetical protein